MMDAPISQPGTRSFFAGQLAAWSRLLSENIVGAYAQRHVGTAVTIGDRKSYMRYCTELLVRGLSTEIVKKSLTMRCRTDDTELVEIHSVEVVILSKDEYRRLQSDLLHAARVIEEMSR